MDNLNYTEKKIINHLKRWHVGESRAVAFRELASELQILEKELRAVVAHLVVDHKQLIGTVTSSGCFWIATEQDYKHTVSEIISRIEKLSLRKKALEYSWIDKNKGQQKLNF